MASALGTEPDGRTIDGPSETAQTLGVAGWTLVSRITGLLRLVVAGATLGPTFFANIFQATNTVPNLTYTLMAGSLLATVVVPTLVEALDRGDLERARRVAQGLLGVVIVGLLGVGVLVVGLGPVVVRLVTLGIGADDAGQARGQAWVLLLLVVPQIVLYGVAAVGVAAQNAQRRFALAAAAPSVENLGLVVTLVLAAHWFGSGLATGAVTTSYLVVLGVGSTLSVAAHAALQLVGAARAGLSLRPIWGWPDPAVRSVLRRIIPTIGTAALEAGWLLALVVAAGTVPGGVIAFQIGFKLYNLPLALGARAVGTVLMPRLAREIVRGDVAGFGRTYARGLARSWFVAVPASVGLICLARPIAEVLAFGKFDQGSGLELVTASVATLGLALVGAATYEIARQASYARLDVRAPLVGGVGQFAVVLTAIPGAVILLDGAATLAVLGLAVTTGSVLRAVIVDRFASRGIPLRLKQRTRALVRHIAVSIVTVVPAAVLAGALSSLVHGRTEAMIAVALGSLGGLAAYVALQAVIHAPELEWTIRRARPGPVAVAGEGGST